MSLLYKLYRLNFLPIIDNQVSLRIKRLLVSYLKKNQYLKRRNKKSDKVRTFVSTFNLEGSITVEAALVVTVFLMLMLSLISVLQIFNVYQDVHRGLVSAGHEAAIMGDSILGTGSVYLYMAKTVDSETLENKGIKNGIKGISFLGTFADIQNQKVVLNASYKVKPTLLLLPGINVRMSHHLEFRAWSGYKKSVSDTDNDSMVSSYYIAENESVYHSSAQCSHLRLTISAVDIDDISGLKNSNGHSYSRCSKCSGYSEGTVVFITEDGTKYHHTLMCSGLKRTVHKVQDIGMLNPCSRCGGV